MISITKIYEFEAAHNLIYYVGRCRNMHGHSYKVEITVSADYDVHNTLGHDYGMVMDFRELDEYVEPFIDTYFDHEVLNQIECKEVKKFYPTAENIARLFAEHVQNELVKNGKIDVHVDRVVVWETKNSYATWTR